MDILGALSGTAWSALFFVVALSIIVAIHEYGHYIVGRWSGIHAEVFSVGFGPTLFSRVDRRGTRWQVAAIPFGGYVKFAGDADASSVRAIHSGADLSAAERRRTMAGAPVWARAATVAAGPLANFILTFAVLLGMLFVNGVAVERPGVGKLYPLPVSQPLQEGDVILGLNGTPTPSFEAFFEVLADVPSSLTVPMQVERAGTVLDVMAPNPRIARIASVQLKSAALDAGLAEGDVILAANGETIAMFSDLQKIVMASDGAPVSLQVWRDGQTFTADLQPRPRDVPRSAAEGGGFERRWMVGVASGLAFDPPVRAVGVFEGVRVAGAQMWDMVTTTISGLYHMIAGQISSCNISGVIGIAETMGDAAKTGPSTFVMMIAVLSMGVGILNLLPVPVLDGGHLVFHAYEALRGKPPSERALHVLMTAGMALLLSLMLFSLWNDVTCV